MLDEERKMLEEFKKRLMEAESAAAMDQNRFAESIGLGAQTYRNVLKASLGPSLTLLYRIQAAKGAEFLNWLMHGQIDGCHPLDADLNFTRPITSEPNPEAVTVPVYASTVIEWVKGIPELKQRDSGDDAITLVRKDFGWRGAHQFIGLRLDRTGMGEAIPAGSIVVVDIDDKRFKPGGVFLTATPDRSGNWGVFRGYNWKGGYNLLSDSQGVDPIVTELKWEALCVGVVVLCCHKVE